MTDWRVVVKSKLISDDVDAVAFAQRKREEAEHIAGSIYGTGYNDWLVRRHELPQGGNLVEWKEFVKVPAAQAIGRQVDLGALREMPQPKRDYLTSVHVSEEWEALRKAPVVLPKFMQKGRLKNDDE